MIDREKISINDIATTLYGSVNVNKADRGTIKSNWNLLLRRLHAEKEMTCWLKSRNRKCVWVSCMTFFHKIKMESVVHSLTSQVDSSNVDAVGE